MYDRKQWLEEIPKKFLKKKFKIIYADPPWTMRDKARAGKRGASYKYNVLTDQEISEFPMDKMADPSGCLLFCWVTWPKLMEFKEILKVWDFEYKTIGFVWVKKNKNKGTPFMGMGNYTRANTEPCLIAKVGKIARVHKGIPQLVIAPVLEHSAKPPEVRQRIEMLMGPQKPRIELFAREIVKGWRAFGDELDEK